jgi:hypothetical protein
MEEEEDEGSAPEGDKDDAAGIAMACSLALVRVPNLLLSLIYNEDMHAVVAICIRTPASMLHAAQCSAATSCCTTDGGWRGTPSQGCACMGAAAIVAMTMDKQGGGCSAISHAVGILHDRICMDNDYGAQYCPCCNDGEGRRMRRKWQRQLHQ